jgi:hypothetical protein
MQFVSVGTGANLKDQVILAKYIQEVAHLHHDDEGLGKWCKIKNFNLLKILRAHRDAPELQVW